MFYVFAKFQIWKSHWTDGFLIYLNRNLDVLGAKIGVLRQKLVIICANRAGGN